MDRLEESMNSLTDMDLGWWPVLTWRPQKDQDIDNMVLLKISLVFGSLLGLIAWLPDIARTSRINPIHAIYFIVGGWIVFFLIYKYSFALMWNRRARRLREKH